MDINREDLAWAGGLFEGEGSIVWTTVRNRNPKLPRWTRCQLSLHMCDEDVVRKFASIIGIGGVTGPYTYTDDVVKERKPSWYWAVGAFEKTQAVLAMLWPWLCSRRRGKAKEVLQKELLARPCKKGPKQNKSSGRFE